MILIAAIDLNPQEDRAANSAPRLVNRCAAQNSAAWLRLRLNRAASGATISTNKTARRTINPKRKNII